MTRAALLFMIALLAPPFATRGAEAAELGYSLYVLSVPAADATLSLDLEPSDYRIGLRYHTIGLADLVASDSLDARTVGTEGAAPPSPRDYASNSVLRGQLRVVDMIWRDGSPVVTATTPPNNSEREEVPRPALAAAVDPLTSIVQLLRQVAASGRCEGHSRSYDGRRLEVYQTSTAGEEDLPATSRSSFSGRALRCAFTDQPLAGFRLGSGHDDDARLRRGTVWLSPIIPEEPPLPVRIAFQTLWLGDAMIYLTSARP